MDNIDSSAAIISVVSVGVGRLVKGWDVIPTKYIPVIVTLVSVGFVLGLNGFSAEALLQGLHAGLASTGMHQVYSQLSKHENEKPDSGGASN